jgi:hypothetical protein
LASPFVPDGRAEFQGFKVASSQCFNVLSTSRPTSETLNPWKY